MEKNLYPQTLPLKTAQLIKKIQEKKPKFLKGFYLSGGTGLSLQLGHRKSIDLDFFNQKGFDPKLLEAELETLGQLKELELKENTLNAFLKEVQIQFLTYPYPLLKPTINWKNIRISSVLDIACTKLQTIGARGDKKDFVDLYFILNKYSLNKLFEKLDEKYKKAVFNKVHILKSLTYFRTAESQPMPQMNKKVSWGKIKQIIIKKVKKIKL